MFTINCLNLSGTLRRFLATTNLIDSTDSGVRQPIRRVTNWQHGTMALRRAAAGFVETEKNYCRIMGYQQLWMLKAALDESPEDEDLANHNVKPDNVTPPKPPPDFQLPTGRHPLVGRQPPLTKKTQSVV